jgi:hypothetical protein
MATITMLRLLNVLASRSTTDFSACMDEMEESKNPNLNTQGPSKYIASCGIITENPDLPDWFIHVEMD